VRVPRPLTYREAGVDIDAGDEAVRRIRALAAATSRPEVLGGIGAFASFVRVPADLRDPVMVSSTDGVGTKLRIAFLTGRHDTVGIDLVAMGVNDVLVHGAEPLFFLDYLAVHRVDPPTVEAIVAGVAEGCRRAGCALVGGETAELGDFYTPGEYDLAGFAVGVAERSRLVTGAAVQAGDRLLGLASSGLHSNGYSLVRRVLERAGVAYDHRPPELGRTIGEELLEPTRIYAADLVDLLAAGVELHALCHVTGGGLPGNLPRSLPSGLVGRIDRSSWTPPPIFGLLAGLGPVDEAELARATNLGVGMVAVLPSSEVERASSFLAARGIPNWVMGEVTAQG